MAKKKESATKTKTRKSQAKVLEYLEESGNISSACKRAGISRQTFYNWYEERPFRVQADEAIGLGKSFVNDLAHNHLIRKINEGDAGLIKFQLASCHPDYQPRKPWPREAHELTPPVTKIEIIPIEREVMQKHKDMIREKGISDEKKDPRPTPTPPDPHAT